MISGMDTAQVADLAARLADTTQGDMVERSAAAEALGEAIGRRLARTGGSALFIDYGAGLSLGDSFQALRGHRRDGPLDHPGLADLTAHVDFGAFGAAARRGGAQVWGPLEQGVFLERLGIGPRAQKLAETATGPARKNIIAAHRRLTHPAEMGSLFKTVVLTPSHSPAPPVFQFQDD